MNQQFYNLIIRADEQSPFPVERIFDGQVEIDESLKNSNGEIDWNYIVSLPTITTREFINVKNAMAQIGYISSKYDNKLRFVVTTFPADLIVNFCDGPELSFGLGGRTRWKILKGDPYRKLGELNTPKSSADRTDIPQFSDMKINQSQIALMMPFREGLPTPMKDPVYEHIHGAAVDQGFECRRVDEICTPGSILQDIYDLIESSAIIIADLTGANPNVYYEVGLAHARGKDVILISSDRGSYPFDISMQRIIRYYSDDEGSLKNLSENISKSIVSIRERKVPGKF
ncbi:hypothetical protein GCM10007377_11100 [Galliscardovia ingluviei]|uniref:Nucleoside 2-deoxyribosyltransferase n=1 Tax=Galliscardovia ingluviei TaxID=1769422 RepID=A0A8J3APK3_9BIFI|nr:hypothetical protein [Galliscardovia ingluviei]GGI14471.1 hypothetical protein GCM10007377_11100 [Galliscardovia ingluviei]